MKDFLTAFTPTEFFIYTILLVLAIKQAVTFFDWANKRVRQKIQKEDKPFELACVTKEHGEQLSKIEDQIVNLGHILNVLIQSDQDMIRLTIKKEHHYYVYQKGSIDSYSLDCIERLYARYSQEGGNTYVKDLMEQLRALPKDN